MKRLFFALWPDDTARQDCVKIIRYLDNGKGRPVNPDNLHVTLLFLGNVTPDKENDLKQAARLITVPEIRLSFNQVSFWKKQGVLCLTTTNVDDGLLKLIGNIEAVARKLAIPFDVRTVKPHVTLFRKVEGIAAYDFDTLHWHSSSFRLVESQLLMHTVEYRTIESWDAN